MSNKDKARRANIRLAIILGLVAFSFFLLGLYLSTGVEG